MKCFNVTDSVALTPYADMRLGEAATRAPHLPALSDSDLQLVADIDERPQREHASRAVARKAFHENFGDLLPIIAAFKQEGAGLLPGLASRLREARLHTGRARNAYPPVRRVIATAIGVNIGALATVLAASLSIAAVLICSTIAFSMLLQRAEFPSEQASLMEVLPMTAAVVLASFWAISTALSTTSSWVRRGCFPHLGIGLSIAGVAATLVFIRQIALASPESFTDGHAVSWFQLLASTACLEGVAMAGAKYALTSSLSEMLKATYEDHGLVTHAMAAEARALDEHEAALSVYLQCSALEAQLQMGLQTLEEQAVSRTDALRTVRLQQLRASQPSRRTELSASQETENHSSNGFTHPKPR